MHPQARQLGATPGDIGEALGITRQAADAVALGLVDEAAAPGLARLFGRPAPWMHDFF